MLPHTMSCVRFPSTPSTSTSVPRLARQPLPLIDATSFPSFNGWGLSIVDSLDTMWIMGLYEEFDAGLAVVANTTFPTAPVRTPSPSRMIIFVEIAF